MADEIVWAEPPAAALRAVARGRYQKFAETLRTRPNEWAVLPDEKKTPESAKNAALLIRTGKMKAFLNKGDWESVAHECTVYVRFVGEPDSEPEGESAQSADDTEAGDVPLPSQWEAHRVRLWARENGYDVADRGVLRNDVLQAYERAHSGEVQPSDG